MKRLFIILLLIAGPVFGIELWENTPVVDLKAGHIKLHYSTQDSVIGGQTNGVQNIAFKHISGGNIKDLDLNYYIWLQGDTLKKIYFYRNGGISLVKFDSFVTVTAPPDTGWLKVLSSKVIKADSGYIMRVYTDKDTAKFNIEFPYKRYNKTVVLDSLMIYWWSKDDDTLRLGLLKYYTK